jgi:multidrug resistance efflux pump
MDVPRSNPRKNHRRWLIGAGVAGVGITATILLGSLRTAAPSVERSSVWIDTVKRGDMLREVQGQGTLVPEQIQWVSAVGAARVEKILVKPGTAVDEDTVLVELSNPDVQLQALEAERQWTTASAELVNLQATQRNQRLGQESVVASLRSDLNEARLRSAADLELANKGFLSGLEMSQSKAKADELSGRVEFEQKRLAALSDGMTAQVAAQRAQVERLRSIAEFRRHEVEGLRVRANVGGVLQELPLQVGQWVAPGTLLAKVVQPEKLKAELRVAETRMKDVQIGQRASIDTRNGIVAGHVARIDPAAQAGTVKIDVELDGQLPKGARPDLSVEGTIELERLANILFVGRPAFSQSEGQVGIFKLVDDGRYAERVKVRLGRSSVKTVEVVSGLREGDQVILSDLSQWDSVERIRLR